MINDTHRYINIYGNSDGRMRAYSISYGIDFSRAPRYDDYNTNKTIYKTSQGREVSGKEEGTKEKED